MHAPYLSLILRFVIPLAAALGLAAFIALPAIDDVTARWFIRDLDAHAQLLANALREPLLEQVPQHADEQINRLFERAMLERRAYALAFCDQDGKLRYRTFTYPESLGCRQAMPPGGTRQFTMQLPQGPVRITENMLQHEKSPSLGTLILVHDMGFIERRSADTKTYLIALFTVLALVTSSIAVLVALLSWRGWVNAVKTIVRTDLRTRSPAGTPPELRPLIGQLRDLLHEFDVDRRKKDNSPQAWTPEKLRVLLREELSGDEVLVVSNREPYIHAHTPQGIEVQRPASGLVTAVEPVMQACSGTWIAHGSGSADRDTVDRNGRIPVPPAQPGYTLRRVWLSAAEEQGYYYGFSNEGLWPLCHIAHVRPAFRSSDWEQYAIVNQRFADTVVHEARTDNPVILVQDYHFALLPRMVRERLPNATIITFWHIPWPNPESFGICPWREEILEGLLGSTILGFHTRYHCQNFFETIDRYLETRIEREASTISYGGKLTQVENYPISIAWPEPAEQPDAAPYRAAVREELGLPPDHLLALGVDRMDYTKGIIERFQAIETLLESRPALVGRLTMIQIAAPSRSLLDEYRHFETRVRALAQRINARFSSGKYEPILLKTAHHDAGQINRYYRATDVCVVTSLHDGMNLVAKEFIAARNDERGVLILSQFTGAARELHEALIVNPYYVEQSAEAIYRGLTMPELEQRERMRSMRSIVKDFNVYRWAGRMLIDAARLRKREQIMMKIRSTSQSSTRRVV